MMLSLLLLLAASCAATNHRHSLLPDFSAVTTAVESPALSPNYGSFMQIRDYFPKKALEDPLPPEGAPATEFFEFSKLPKDGEDLKAAPQMKNAVVWNAGPVGDGAHYYEYNHVVPGDGQAGHVQLPPSYQPQFPAIFAPPPTTTTTTLPPIILGVPSPPAPIMPPAPVLSSVLQPDISPDYQDSLPPVDNMPPPPSSLQDRYPHYSSITHQSPHAQLSFYNIHHPPTQPPPSNYHHFQQQSYQKPVAPQVTLFQKQQISQISSSFQQEQQFPPSSYQKPQQQFPPVSYQKPQQHFPPISHQNTQQQFPPISHQNAQQQFPPISHQNTQQQFPPISHQKPQQQFPPVSHQKPQQQFPSVSHQKPQHQFPPVSQQKPQQQFSPVSYQKPQQHLPPVSHQKPQQQFPTVSYQKPQQQLAPVSYQKPQQYRPVPTTYQIPQKPMAPLPMQVESVSYETIPPPVSKPAPAVYAPPPQVINVQYTVPKPSPPPPPKEDPATLTKKYFGMPRPIQMSQAYPKPPTFVQPSPYPSLNYHDREHSYATIAGIPHNGGYTTIYEYPSYDASTPVPYTTRKYPRAPLTPTDPPPKPTRVSETLRIHKPVNLPPMGSPKAFGTPTTLSTKKKGSRTAKKMDFEELIETPFTKAFSPKYSSTNSPNEESNKKIVRKYSNTPKYVLHEKLENPMLTIPKKNVSPNPKPKHLASSTKASLPRFVTSDPIPKKITSVTPKSVAKESFKSSKSDFPKSSTQKYIKPSTSKAPSQNSKMPQNTQFSSTKLPTNKTTRKPTSRSITKYSKTIYSAMVTKPKSSNSSAPSKSKSSPPKPSAEFHKSPKSSTEYRRPAPPPSAEFRSFEQEPYRRPRSRRPPQDSYDYERSFERDADYSRENPRYRRIPAQPRRPPSYYEEEARPRPRKRGEVSRYSSRAEESGSYESLEPLPKIIRKDLHHHHYHSHNHKHLIAPVATT